MASVEQVIAALQASTSSTDHKVQSQATKWLASFQATDEAWEVAFSLLQHTDPAISRNAAFMLSSKVRTDWRATDAARRSALYGSMTGLLQGVISGTVAVAPAAVAPFGTAVSSAALSEGGDILAGFVQACVAIGGTGSGSSSSDDSGLRMALALLTAVGSEGFMRNHRNRSDLAAAVTAQAAPIACMLERAALGGNCASSAEEAVAAAAAGGGGGVLPVVFSPDAPIDEGQLAALSLTPLARDAIATLQVLATSGGLSLGVVQSLRPGLIAAAVLLLAEGATVRASRLVAPGVLMSLIADAGQELEAVVTAAGLAPDAGAPTASPLQAAAALAASAVLPVELAQPLRSATGGYFGSGGDGDEYMAGEGGAAGGGLIGGDGAGASGAAHRVVAAAVARSEGLDATQAPLLDEAAVRSTVIGLCSIAVGVGALRGLFRTHITTPKGGRSAAFVQSVGQVCNALVCCATLLIVGAASPLNAAAAGAAGSTGASSVAIPTLASPIVDCLLDCAQHTSLRIMETADEVWPYIAAVPAAHRAQPFATQHLFARVAESLVRGASFPEAFPATGDWDEYDTIAQGLADEAKAAAAAAAAGDAGGDEDEDDDFEADDLLSLDSESFHRFRDTILATSLQCAFEELGVGLIDYLATSVAHASEAGWQAMEAVLFATRSIAPAVKASLRRTPKDAVGAAAHAATTAYVTSLFAAVAAADATMTTCPPVIAAAAHCTFSFSSYIAAHATSVDVDGVAHFLLNALQVPQAAKQAAESLRIIADKQAARFATPEGVAAFGGALSAAMESGALTGEDVDVAAAAVVKVISGLADATARAEAVQSVLQMVTPRVRGLSTTGAAELSSLRATIAAAASTASPAAASSRPAASGERVSLLDAYGGGGSSSSTAAVRAAREARKRYDAIATSIGEELATVAAVIAAARPEDITPDQLGALLGPVAEAMPDSEAAIAGVCAVITGAMSRAGGRLAGVLAPYIDFLLGVHERRAHGAVVDAVASALESVAGGKTDVPATELAALFTRALERLLLPVFALLAASVDSVLEQPELYRSTFAAVTTYVEQAPSIALASPHLPTTVQAAMTAVKRYSQDSAGMSQAALKLVGRLFFLASPLIPAAGDGGALLLTPYRLSPAEYPAVREQVTAALAGTVTAPLVTQLLTLAIEGTSPRLIDYVGDALLACVSAFSDVANPAMDEVLAAMPTLVAPEAVEALAADGIVAAVRDKLYATAAANVGQPGTPATQGFRDFIRDLSAVSAGKKNVSVFSRTYAPPSAAVAASGGLAASGFASAASLGAATGFVSASRLGRV